MAKKKNNKKVHFNGRKITTPVVIQPTEQLKLCNGRHDRAPAQQKQLS